MCCSDLAQLSTKCEYKKTPMIDQMIGVFLCRNQGYISYGDSPLNFLEESLGFCVFMRLGRFTIFQWSLLRWRFESALASPYILEIIKIIRWLVYIATHKRLCYSLQTPWRTMDFIVKSRYSLIDYMRSTIEERKKKSS